MKIKIKINLFKVCFMALSWGILITLLYFTYKDAKHNITNTIKNGMYDAIDIDYHKRLNKVLVLQTPTGRKLKGMHIETEDGTETIFFNDSTDESTAIKLCNQYVLSKIIPPNPDDINELLKDELEKKNIGYEKAGVIYFNKGKRIFSNNDSTNLKSSIITPVEYIDARKTIAIQAWTNVKWYQVIVMTSQKTLWSVGAYFIVLVFVSLSFIIKPKKSESPFNSEHIEFGRMILDTENYKLYIDNKLCQIAPTDFKLLALFVNAPNHFLTKECIKKEFWASDINSDNKIHSHISTLKSSLKDYPQIRIITKINKGYQLDITPQN